MSTFIETVKRNAYGTAALLLSAAIILPSMFAAHVGAAQLTSRSIVMSTSSIGATGVEYDTTFTTSAAMQSFVVNFCTVSPLMEAACTRPTGMVTSGVSSLTAGWTASSTTAGEVKVTHTSSQSAGVINVELSGITNPTGAAGTFYARITTYSDATYGDYTDVTDVGTPVDNGGVALSTTEDIEVSAAVLETLTFCVQNDTVTPTADCANAGSNLPNLTLGSGTPPALSSSNVDTEGAYFQISTNASGTTTIRMVNGAASGGLNSGSNSIPPVDNAATPAAIVAGTPNFGMRVGTPADAVGGSGAASVAGATTYASATNYNMLLDATASGNGVDSPYGSTIATATGGVDSVNVPLTFAATISPTTPAGLYTANISLIASSSY